MYERKIRQRAPWPPGAPRPGDPSWPDGAINWLTDQVPTVGWRRSVLAGQPWMMTIIAATAVRAELDALRQQYRLTATTWSAMLPEPTTRALLAATSREGRRLTVLLEQVLALENALSPGQPELKAGPEGGRAVGAAP
jgi:hypothetical protein